MHIYIIRHPEHDEIKIHMAKFGEAFKFSVQETLKDLMQNCKDINLKQVQELSSS